MTRRIILFITAAAICGLAFWAVDEESEFQPSTARMERLAGAELSSPPRYHSSSVAQRLYDEIWITVRMWTLPMPNMMAIHLRGDSWKYEFTADSMYRPPATSGFTCQDVEPGHDFTCRRDTTTAEGNQWIYKLNIRPDDERGTITAVLLPEKE